MDPTRSGIFEVKSYYQILSMGHTPHFPWKSIWKVKIPLKVAFFARTAAWGQILTMENLRSIIFSL